MASRLVNYKFVAGGVSAEYYADTKSDITNLPTTISVNIASEYGKLTPSIGSTCTCVDYDGSLEVLILTTTGWKVM